MPQKCTGCAHLIDAGWTETRCTQVCPTGALKLVLADDDAMAAKAAAEGLEAYRPNSAPPRGSGTRTSTAGPRASSAALWSSETPTSAPTERSHGL